MVAVSVAFGRRGVRREAATASASQTRPTRRPSLVRLARWAQARSNSGSRSLSLCLAIREGPARLRPPPPGALARRAGSGWPVALPYAHTRAA